MKRQLAACSMLGAIIFLLTAPATPSPGDDTEPEKKISGNAPHGLTLEAGEATVKQGEKVSIPIFLRYNGDGQPPLVADMNFDVKFQPQVAVVRPHPNPARQATAGPDEQPDFPRGNLLGGGVLIAGNAKEAGSVRIGFAGKKGVKPGTGQPSETVTEILFEAVGKPGDETELALHVTICHDTSGKKLDVQLVPGRIRILDDKPPPVVVKPIPDPPPGGDHPQDEPLPPHNNPPPIKNPPPKKPPRRTALDAYIALLMSIQRRPVDDNYDVDQDSKVTSRDSTRILQDAAKTAGEGR